MVWNMKQQELSQLGKFINLRSQKLRSKQDIKSSKLGYI